MTHGPVEMARVAPPSAERSALMSRVKSKDTAPEIAVRRTAHALGYRFRLQRKDLPGRPDIVFPSKKKVIFVHGCFWHRHPECRLASTPKTRADFWNDKFDRNVHRDGVVTENLIKLGWEVLVIWECETRNREKMQQRLQHFLNDCEALQ